MDTENADGGEVLILPKLSRKRIKSKLGIVRLVQLILCLSSFVCVQFSPTCIEIELRHQFVVRHCSAPNVYVFRIFLAGIVFTFLTTLVAYCVFISNLTAVIRTVPWDKLIYFHTVVCICVLLLINVLFAFDDFSSTASIVGQVLGLIALTTYFCHFYLQFINSGQLGGHSSDQSHSEVSADSDGQDDPEFSGEIPTLSVVRQRLSSLESMNDTTDRPVVSSVMSELSFHHSSQSISSDESEEDPRSWVISGGSVDDDEEEEEEVDFAVNVPISRLIKEDTMSTDTYTVETSSDVHQ